ncbi:metal-sensitive transcriptional regulator [Solibacillus sp. FSL H8-0538]|uniref:metal-sensitive transcriptional regulator n=1 Tax=Solibacillus sp. FSL H8-0538 TaxID=2921400 RepID=UPI0030FCDCAD
MNYDAKVTNRLKRIEGQLRAVLRMMEEDKDCKEVITQLSAIRSGVDRTIGVIVTDNLLECIKEADGDDQKMNQVVQEAINLVVKSR